MTLSVRATAKPSPSSKRLARKASMIGAVFNFITQASLGFAAFAFVSLGGPDAALQAILPQAIARPTAPMATAAQITPVRWTIDIDADGVADFSNPTHGAIRGVDVFGAGAFNAARDAGKRRHHGVDYVVAAGEEVRAPIGGQVQRLGFAYDGDTTLRYAEIINPDTKMSARVLYLDALVSEGDIVAAGDVIGVAQDLTRRYPGITNHVHVELRDAHNQLVDAATQLPLAPVLQAAVAIIDARS